MRDAYSMLPLKCESQSNRTFPFVTITIIAACAAVFAAQIRFGFAVQGFVPVNLSYALFHPAKEGPRALACLFMSFFLHANLLHLVANMWYLWIFGVSLERLVGHGRFAGAYLACGALSMVIQAARSPLSGIPVVGASGAIAGLMGLHLARLPLSRIIVWFPPMFLLRIPALVFLIFWFLIQYLNLRAPSTGGGVAWWAHAGGFVCGAVGAIFLGPSERRTSRA